MNEVTLAGPLRAPRDGEAARFGWLPGERGELAIVELSASTVVPAVFEVRDDSRPVGSTEGAAEVTGRLVSSTVVYQLGDRRQVFRACWVQVGTSRPIPRGARPDGRVSVAGTVVSVHAPWQRGSSWAVNAAIVVPDECSPAGQVLVSAVVTLREGAPPPLLRPGARVEVAAARLGMSRYAVGGRPRQACAVECGEDDIVVR